MHTLYLGLPDLSAGSYFFALSQKIREQEGSNWDIFVLFYQLGLYSLESN